MTATVEVTFEVFSRQCRQRVDSALEHLLPAVAGPQARLYEAMRYSVFNGGKRIRPVLAYAAAGALAPLPAAVGPIDSVACALECIHAYSLIHDDLPAMDDDDLRRGKPTSHIAFDEATAILAGDALQALAFETLCEPAALSADIRLGLVQRLARAAGGAGMVAGQAVDLESVDRHLSLEQLQHMHNRKTGALIEAGVIMGAMATGVATRDQLTALEAYARAVGLAFQIQDDILDVVADTATLGKRQGADQALNKPTYVSLLGLEEARRRAATLSEQACDSLCGFDEQAQRLRELARYIVKRSS
ncbi:(2E,6E)-farnesyl diphosphate synthase [Exilibacterium tricleocarpae]|uniref:(2E,6E)-farnesyl diphosphate synthase n=1 Tax=Exilibacterium tricleocarpae TaxID=2591008 RepID=A0A545SSU9_9GAMM|nr:farnesyl diphosphate synthase [Exilibacterium tricleocarpae]TQV68051.1 (2E,6E)-farnesyl diphosphate synthase [Exilibacterium tricleocarpae]